MKSIFRPYSFIGKGGWFCGLWLLVLVAVILSGCGCLSKPVRIASSPAGPARTAIPAKKLAILGYSIQVGAFSQLDNAVRLMGKLDAMGLDAYYYRDRDRLYKVRFGDYASKKAASLRAFSLRDSGLIEAFYIVAPSEYAVSRRHPPAGEGLRQMLVTTAAGFLGIPYRWGGESAATGFDCSGLAMTVYKMNGLNLPRNSREQFGLGSPVDREELRPGDLVFFATNGDGEVSHVGIYVGDRNFIHAPKPGEVIRQASLDQGYFGSRYLGARSYLSRDG